MKTMFAAAIAATLLSLAGCATDRETAYTAGGAVLGNSASKR
jgi:hypothetical protein